MLEKIKKIWVNFKSGDDLAKWGVDNLSEKLSKQFQLVSGPKELPDLCICISGDGTLLSSIRKLKAKNLDIPILPIHGSGGLGFLHPISVPKSKDAVETWSDEIVESIKNNKFKFFTRNGIDCDLSDNKSSIWAFNDVVISKGALSRMIRFNVNVDGVFLYQAARGDGMIFSSSTGSTAYSMSAGGPLVHPSLSAMIITPVCLHQIMQRPVVVDSNALITVEILDANAACYLTADGQEGFELKEGDKFTVKQNKNAVTFVCPEISQFNASKNFYSVIQDKLGFGVLTKK